MSVQQLLDGASMQIDRGSNLAHCAFLPFQKFFFSLGCVIIFENAQPVAGDPDEVQKRSQASEFIDKRIVVQRSQIILIIEGCVLVTRSVFVEIANCLFSRPSPW
ncbi:hypothetical protein C8J57DRAFT_1252188 [Mycena rebaudengoi]|nr:hypothetical protein C8J57DRAFT_1252188 [Mycena rebaudengoi]